MLYNTDSWNNQGLGWIMLLHHSFATCFVDVNKIVTDKFEDDTRIAKELFICLRCALVLHTSTFNWITNVNFKISSSLFFRRRALLMLLLCKLLLQFLNFFFLFFFLFSLLFQLLLQFSNFFFFFCFLLLYLLLQLSKFFFFLWCFCNCCCSLSTSFLSFCCAAKEVLSLAWWFIIVLSALQNEQSLTS